MLKTYLHKFRRAERSPKPPALAHAAFSALGGLLAIALIAMLTQLSAVPFLMAPFGATCVLAFGVPDSPLAQPRNIIGGHFLSAFIGLLCLHLLGTDWFSLAVGVSLAIGMMQLTGTTHPPAGANPIVVILAKAKWSFLFSPVLSGALVLVVVALLFNNASKARRYPKYWL
ncbi:HPP family protein [Pontibacter ummariensis]|uniref:HPP family protein n=1 Tax=Pontibacter ummariensis TaxID=1610492 RepID=A0A239LK80_9BACT|nr:HPP family protein [Pontibacter ummariensis]PRY03132.1 HPP family protein [Pontibacter ummariensis]SNT30302.1 HPP family protein [Pontibacter ummariensis]